MKTIKRDCSKPIFQGDCMIMRVAAVPAGAKEAKSKIVAHSETGHHHVAERARVFEVDATTLYLQAIGKSIDIKHLRPTDTHETIRLLAKPGEAFIVKRQREHAPEGWRRVED